MVSLFIIINNGKQPKYLIRYTEEEVIVQTVERYIAVGENKVVSVLQHDCSSE